MFKENTQFEEKLTFLTFFITDVITNNDFGPHNAPSHSWGAPKKP